MAHQGALQQHSVRWDTGLCEETRINGNKT
jgi:hypothetical protein